MNSSRLKRAYDMIPTNSNMALADDTSMAARKFLCVHKTAHIMTARTKTINSGAQHRVALLRCWTRTLLAVTSMTPIHCSTSTCYINDVHKTLGGPNVLLKWITGSHRQSKHHAAVCSDSDMQFVNRDPHRGQVHAKGACHGGHERKHEHDAVDHQVEGHKLVAPVVQVQSNEVLCVCHLRTWHTPLGNYCAVSTAVPAVCWCQVHRHRKRVQAGRSCTPCLWPWPGG